jgi:hypothetical protein
LLGARSLDRQFIFVVSSFSEDADKGDDDAVGFSFVRAHVVDPWMLMFACFSLQGDKSAEWICYRGHSH